MTKFTINIPYSKARIDAKNYEEEKPSAKITYLFNEKSFVYEVDYKRLVRALAEITVKRAELMTSREYANHVAEKEEALLKESIEEIEYLRRNHSNELTDYFKKQAYHEYCKNESQ